jgi:lipopolysaccharide/colanic/teichoic acid biosynthesis glycosyltransferase
VTDDLYDDTADDLERAYAAPSYTRTALDRVDQMTTRECWIVVALIVLMVAAIVWAAS